MRTAAEFGDVVLVHNRKPSVEQWLLRRLKQLAPDKLTLYRVDPYQDPLYMNLVGAPALGGAAAPRNSPHSLRFFILSNMLASGDFISLVQLLLSCSPTQPTCALSRTHSR